MNAAELLADLERQGAEFRFGDHDRLRIRAPSRVLTEDVRSALKRHKSELLTLIHRRYEVPDGWSRRSWIERLQYIARICIHEGRSRELTEWADALSALGPRSESPDVPPGTDWAAP